MGSHGCIVNFKPLGNPKTQVMVSQQDLSVQYALWESHWNWRSLTIMASGSWVTRDTKTRSTATSPILISLEYCWPLLPNLTFSRKRNSHFLSSHSHLWSWNLGNDRKSQVMVSAEIRFLRWCEMRSAAPWEPPDRAATTPDRLRSFPDQNDRQRTSR